MVFVSFGKTYSAGIGGANTALHRLSHQPFGDVNHILLCLSLTRDPIDDRWCPFGWLNKEDPFVAAPYCMI